MMARTLSRVAARICSTEAPGVFSAMALPILASTAGHIPSSADSQSGRATTTGACAQAGSAAFALIRSGSSDRLSKKAFQEGST